MPYAVEQSRKFDSLEPVHFCLEIVVALLLLSVYYYNLFVLMQRSSSADISTCPCHSLDIACGICRQTLHDNPKLCGNCQVWNDARHVFQCMEIYTGDASEHFTPFDVLESRRECLICSATAAGVTEYLSLPRYKASVDTKGLLVSSKGPFCFETKRTERYGLPEINLNETGPSTIKCVVPLIITTQHGFSKGLQLSSGIEKHSEPTCALQLKLYFDQAGTHLCRVECWETSFLDVNKVKTWINSCAAEHQKTCIAKPTALPAHFRVIDTRLRCIVTPPKAVQYVTLSYVWNVILPQKDLTLGETNLVKLQESGSLTRENVPELIWDAIRLCQDLGEAYLWVDRLCINQDEDVQDTTSSKFLQINAMDRIYCQAVFTIVAAVDGNHGLGLPGVRGRPRNRSLLNHTRNFQTEVRIIQDNFRTTINSSLWNTRGWTFQERLLSRRCLYVTEWQAYFTCGQGAVQEELGYLSRSNVLTSDALCTIKSPREYLECVRSYRARNLTKQSDILFAFTGVSNMLEIQLNTTFLSGHPERWFLQTLLWGPDGQMQMWSAQSNIPSWSWAGWIGGVRYNSLYNNTTIEATEIGTLCQFYVQHSRGGLRKVKMDETWFFHEKSLDDFQSMEMIPVQVGAGFPNEEDSTRMWTDCPHNPWSARAQRPPDAIATSLAAKNPGRVVFTTTSARLFLSKHHASPINRYFSRKSFSEMAHLSICTERGQQIGHMMGMDPAFVEKHIDLSSKHDFIVLCAATVPSAYRKALWTDHSQGRNLDDSAWRLHVMLVRKDKLNSGVARRLGIGTIVMKQWKECKPTWETIVLN